MMSEERCICCGSTIPEGVQICPLCARGKIGKAREYVATVTMKDGTSKEKQGDMFVLIDWGEDLMTNENSIEFRLRRDSE